MLLEGLTPMQRRAVETLSPTVCVLAGAGSGKTRVLTQRIAYRVLNGTATPEHCLALTFTKKAAGELQERLAKLAVAGPVNAVTFHSLALHQLRRWWADRRTSEPALLRSKVRLLGELAGARSGLEGAATADLAAAIEWAKARLVPPEHFAVSAQEANRELPGDPVAIGALYARYEDEKRRRRLVDFDDLLVRYYQALSADPRFAAAQSWRWAHVFVDEFQDVNPLQWRVLMGLLGGNDDLFVVGDPNQAIYGWNGADPDFLASFPRSFPDAEVVRLDDNHRSSPQVLAAATAVLGHQSAGFARSSRPDGPLPTLRCFPNDLAEAAGIASEVAQAMSSGLTWDDMAVLGRTNSQLVVVTEALARAGVPYRAPSNIGGSTRGDVEDLEPDDRTMGPRGEPDTMGAVTVCSFHRAKGLQWKAVWVCGLEAGLVPIAYATSPASLAEERRLVYVALTRAEQRLHCSWSNERRTQRGAVLRRSPSPWLPALAPHCSGAGQGSTAPPGPYNVDGAGARALTLSAQREAEAPYAGFIATARSRLTGVSPRQKTGQNRGASSSATPAGTLAVEALRNWRRRVARASGVPPHVLLHDSTLLALARARPTSTEELLRVPGLGPVKVARFGPAILSVLREAAEALPNVPESA
ncbi:MAG: ATP-dependent DNA helicase UvrD2 [Actinobacteria bacterium]|nr:ATP-dependent DNA helicase UvrD2 [Actinomycetota bacterium]